jgi:dihydroneopterin triphosphate diphosphatase
LRQQDYNRGTLAEQNGAVDFLCYTRILAQDVTEYPMAEIPVKCSAVAVTIIRKSATGHELLLLRRTRSLRGEWCHVAGEIEAGETAWQAALREVLEETGLVPRELYSGDICEQFYEADKNAISLLPVFVGFVRADEKVTLNEEHSEFRWADFKTAQSLVTFGGQRNVLRHIAAEFVDRLPSIQLLICRTDQSRDKFG